VAGRSKVGVAGAVSQRLEYGTFRALQALTSACSWRQRLALGRALGRLWHFVDARHRAIARANASGAFPDWPAPRLASMVRANFEHLGATAAEFLALASLSPEELSGRCRIEGRSHLEEALAPGRGVLVLTGHLGNWELAGAAMAAMGYPFYAVGRRQKNPLVDEQVNRLRERFGGRVIPHRNAVRPVFRALREGALIAFLMDQRALQREAVPSWFFGRPVVTNQGLALLALKSGAPVLPAFDQRVGEEHVMRFEAPIHPPEEGDREARVRRFTEKFDAAVEEAVRRCPEQWFWVHRRWRLPEDPE
jgi:KDO2-lipid IV(A) lauroyltransferase